MDDNELTKLAIKLLEKEGEQFVRQRSLGQARQGPLKTNKRFLKATLRNIECANRRINQNIRNFQNKFYQNGSNSGTKEIDNYADKINTTKREDSITKTTKNESSKPNFRNGRPNFMTFIISSSSEDELETVCVPKKNQTKFSLKNEFIKDKIKFNPAKTNCKYKESSSYKAKREDDLDDEVIEIGDSDSSDYSGQKISSPYKKA